ncbi:MAG TPA: sterol desaturase family protein [Candidatus Binatia bacterium]|nr:sterol desaturase family protein [Candidatus Binatia bacterium]
MSDKREELRLSLLSHVPRWYSPLGHVCIAPGIGLAAAIIATLRLHDVRALEWLVVPATFLVANAFEWLIHREVLHRPRLGGFIYKKHTLEHHRLYREETMAVRDWRELPLVLLGPATFSVVALAAALVALVPALVFGANAGWLALATESLYLAAYELLHLSYHLPAGHPIGKLGLIRRWGRHHARHHDPRLMRKWNLNVSIPLTDWLLRTIAPPAAPREPDTTFDD